MANKQSDEGSSSTNILQPKFFKIIFSPRKCSRLTIPEDFASRYCKNMQTPAYLEVPSGQVWEVEVVHSEGQIWLTKGWQDFSDYYSIDCGHFLMFGYNGSSHFNVTIFDVSASEIGYPYDADRGTCCAPKRDQSDNSIEILEDIPRSHGAKGKYSDFVEGYVKTSGHIPLGHSSKRRKQERDAENDDSVDMQDVVSPSFTRNFQKVEYPDSAVHGTCHAPKRGQIESGDSIEILEDIPKSHRGKAKIHDMIARSAENLVHGPLGPSKRKRQGEDEDDISVDMLTKRMEVEKSQEDVASPSFTKKGRKGSEGCMKHEQKNKIVHNANKRVMNKERAIAYQSARAFKSKNPFIISFMQPSYVNSPFNLSVPLKFAKKHFLENYGDLVLRVRGRGSWSVKCTPSTINAKIHSGWKAFVLDNKLKLGDACVFEVIKGTKLIDITIFPAAGSKPRHNIGGGEVPGVSDSKNRIDKTDISVPGSQSKVVLTNKLKLPRGGSYGFYSKIIEGYGKCTEIKHSVGCLGHCPVGQGSTLKRHETDVDDVSIDVCTKRVKVEESPKDAASPSFTRKTKKSAENSWMHKQKSNVVYDKNKTVIDKERALAYQRAKAFKSKNPFLVSFMQPSYLSKPYTLTISSAFAQRYFHEDCGDLVLRVPGRGSWSAKYTKSKATIRSGWKTFVLDNKLEVGDVCVFEVINGTKLIDVTIFPAAGSTPTPKIVGEVSGNSDGKNKLIKNDNSVPCCQSKVVHTNKLKPRRGEEYYEGAEIEHPIEILAHRLSRQGNKRKGLEEEIAGDNVSIDIRTKRIMVEESQENVASPSFTGKTKKSCRAHEQQSRVVSDKSKTVMDKERTIAYQRAKAFQSKNPFIISFMQPSYLSIPYILTISSAFAQKYLLEDCGDLVLRVIGRGSWSVRCSIGTANAKIHSGWKAFVLDNKLNIGDVCVFEVIEGTDQLFIDVTIFRAAESTSMHQTKCQVSGVYVCKDKIIETEDSDPCARPRVPNS